MISLSCWCLDAIVYEAASWNAKARVPYRKEVLISASTKLSGTSHYHSPYRLAGGINYRGRRLSTSLSGPDA